MECNKDEAARAKDIAERKFTEKNYNGAKKFALKAQNLYPGLEGLSQMITTLDVYLCAENKINGQSDWYGILGVNPSDDDETIRKQYRKLALMLHPDKNKAIGAEGAFKLVSEAWVLLSDKAKRLDYTQTRGSKAFHHKVSTQTGVPSAPGASNGYQNLKKNGASNARSHQSNGRASFAAAPPAKKTDTFWTICNRCKTHYEYLRMYLNHTLLCPNCHEAFIAIERDPPPNVMKQSNWSSRQSNPATGHTSTGTTKVSSTSTSFNKTNFQWGPFTQTGATSSAAAQAASLVQQASEKVKRQREENPTATDWERSHLLKETGNLPSHLERPPKKRSSEELHVNGSNTANGVAPGNGGYGAKGETGKANSEAHQIFSMYNNYTKPMSVRELSPMEMRNILMHKAKIKIQLVLKERRSTIMAEFAQKKLKKTMKDQKPSVVSKKPSDPTKEDKEVTPVVINVPDSDFHNFDKDRTEKSFKEDQVWAAYDDDDGMPRFYARIHKVVSLNPFQMRISWLNSRSNSELGPLDWVGRGFTKTCGDFRVGKHESCGTLNSFSHKVNSERVNRGAVRIYPKKSEVWAVYKNWSPDWHHGTPGEEIHDYEMVQIVESFDEEKGVPVAPLTKIPGFRTIFGAKGNERTIPRGEMFRFSHQVPHYLLTGEEADNVEKDFLELDPAATPMELIEVVSEI